MGGPDNKDKKQKQDKSKKGPDNKNNRQLFADTKNVKKKSVPGQERQEATAQERRQQQEQERQGQAQAAAQERRQQGVGRAQEGLPEERVVQEADGVQSEGPERRRWQAHRRL